ncbi:MAG: methylmalonyl Co-A mutase-associated GTPase MeaB [Chloroflexi bacterium]|nr:methylmalonyl Co-A mutase-associated GTPase MeaB [Chloroflexota bacterium]
MSNARPGDGKPLTPVEARRLARLITRVERGETSLPELLGERGRRPRDVYTIGVTGPPGAGKSTLVDKLIGAARAAGLTVGVGAVDPSSPFTGGALLGDRVRMLAHSHDRGVFVRSMAARRALGGLAPATRDALRLIGAFGFGLAMVETVGVGQSELDVVRAVDTVLVITVPGLGDAVQTLKAGLLEIADIFVVNMADRPGADRTAAELCAMQSLAPRARGWTAPVVQTVATEPRGIDELWAAIERHRAYLEQSGEGARRREERREEETLELVQQMLRARLETRLREEPELAETLEQAAQGRVTAREAAERIVRELKS